MIVPWNAYETRPSPVQHAVKVAKTGDGEFTVRGWRAHCPVCRTWYVHALDSWEACVHAATHHAATGTWECAA